MCISSQHHYLLTIFLETQQRVCVRQTTWQRVVLKFQTIFKLDNRWKILNCCWSKYLFSFMCRYSQFPSVDLYHSISKETILAITGASWPQRINNHNLVQGHHKWVQNSFFLTIRKQKKPFTEKKGKFNFIVQVQSTHIVYKLDSKSSCLKVNVIKLEMKKNFHHADESKLGLK